MLHSIKTNPSPPNLIINPKNQFPQVLDYQEVKIYYKF